MTLLGAVRPASVASRADRSRQRRLWGAAAALWVLGYAAIQSTAGVRGTYELWWETRQGQLTLQTGHAVLAHSWSWTAGNVTWIPNSWGWGVLLAMAYSVGGLLGSVAFVFAVQIAFFAMAWSVLGLLGIGQGGVRAGLLVVLSVSMSGWASGRAELADYFAVFSFAAVCLHPALRRASARTRTFCLALGAAVIAAVWENLHLGGVVAILMFASVFIVCECGNFVRPGGRAVPRLWINSLVIAIGAGVGVFATPSGAAGIAKSLVTATKSRAEHYAAWEALFAQPSAFNYGPDILALGIGALALALMLYRRAWVTTAILVLAMVAACAVVRSSTDLVMLSLLAGAKPAARLVRRVEEDLRARQWWRTLPPVAALVAGTWALAAIIVAVTFAVPSWRLTGVDVADLQTVPAGSRIYSTISASDAIALLRPDLQLTTDSRNDLYSVRLFTFVRSLGGSRADQAPAWFARNDVTDAFLAGSPRTEERSKLAQSLARSGWKEYATSHGLLLRAAAPPAG